MSLRARYSRPAGRFFTTRDEVRRIDRDLQEHQQQVGTRVQWYFLDHVGHGVHASVVDDIYDEGLVTSGKNFYGPWTIPVLSAVAAQGQEEPSETGFGPFDRVVLRLSYAQARKAGLDLDLTANREAHLHDRFVYRRLVFDVEAIQTSGHFDPTDRDITINVVGRQMRTEELYDSDAFQEFVRQAPPDPRPAMQAASEVVYPAAAGDPWQVYPSEAHDGDPFDDPLIIFPVSEAPDDHH